MQTDHSTSSKIIEKSLKLSYDEEFIRVPGKHPCNFFEHATCVATIINHYDRNEADFKEQKIIWYASCGITYAECKWVIKFCNLTKV